jgi:hypothetical protein
VSATAPACPRCGAPAGGEYCVDCGGRCARRAPFGDPPRLGPPGRAWPLLTLLLVAAAGTLVAVAATRDAGTQTVVATRYRLVRGARPSAPAPATTAAAAAATLPDVRPAVPIPRPSRPSSTRAGLTTWTLTDGYTTVLASVPSATDQAGARRIARLALQKGLTQVGILDSHGYSSLHPGYLVVFTGMFGSFAAASARASRARAQGFPSAYARQITR